MHACILYANLINLSILIGAASIVHAISTSLIHRYIQYTMYYTYCQHMSRDQLFRGSGPTPPPGKALKKGKTEFKLLKLFMKCSRLSRNHIIISLVLLHVNLFKPPSGTPNSTLTLCSEKKSGVIDLPVVVHNTLRLILTLLHRLDLFHGTERRTKTRNEVL